MKVKTYILYFTALAFAIISCSKPVDRIVKSPDGVEISYTVQGEGTPALVFVHGWSCDKTYWREQVPEFSQKYTVVTVDYGGHGKSGLNRDNFTIESFGDDVAAVVDDLKLEKVILIGHSMGGLVIIDAATKLPGKVEALIGIDTYEKLVDTTFTRELMEQFTAPFYTDFANSSKAFVKTMFAPGADSTLVETIAEDMSSAPQEVAMEAFNSMFEYANGVEEILKTLQIPIYAVSSDLYPTDVEGNRKHAKSFDVKIMKGVGHFLMMENPEMFNRLLGETVDEIVVKK
jgi:pimeloyl-ACP methyl ester carboxylesterase